MQMNDIEWNRD